MKVLLATWSWRPVGGDWTYVDNVKTLYESNGYEVVPFSMKHKDNVASADETFFVQGHDYKELNKNKSLKNSFAALKNSVVSFEALRNIDRLLDEHEIAFAHLHIIHHWLTPAIIWKLKKHGIPVIWSLHEYKVICPEGSFVSKEKVCEKCYNGKFYNCAINRCKKQSLMASLLASFDAYFYHNSGVYNKVDYFLCPSNFLLKKFNQFGFSSSKLVLSNLCYDIDQLDSQVATLKKTASLNAKSETEKYILYIGRIEKIKGILTLIKAVEGTGVQLKIAGTGPALAEMQEYVETHNLTNIKFLGFCAKNIVYDLTLNATCVVCPSEWYENFPYSVIETLLLSKPVIGAEIGGIPELVVNEHTGLLFESANVNQLREKILRLWNDEHYAAQLGDQASTYIRDIVNYKRHWQMLENVISNLPVRKGELLLA